MPKLPYLLPTIQWTSFSNINKIDSILIIETIHHFINLRPIPWRKAPVASVMPDLGMAVL